MVKNANMPGYATKGTTDGKKVDVGIKGAKKVAEKGSKAQPKKNTAKNILSDKGYKGEY